MKLENYRGQPEVMAISVGYLKIGRVLSLGCLIQIVDLIVELRGRPLYSESVLHDQVAAHAASANATSSF